MAKFFNKEYEHAYKRGNKVWVQGAVKEQPYHRMSTGKEFSKANMNYVEKNWDNILAEHFHKQLTLVEREGILTLDEYAVLSFEQNEASRRFYTTKGHKQKYEKFISPSLGSKKLDEIKVRDIKLWYNYLVKNVNSHKYATDIKAVFSTILTDAMDDEYIGKNVVKNTRFPKKENFKNDGSSEVDPFSIDEMYTLINNAEGQFKNILTFQFFTGSRPGEMIALRWEDINFHSKKIHIQRARQGVKNPETGINELGTTKTGRKRKIDMRPEVEEALKEQFKRTGLKDEFVFLTIHDEPYMDYDGLRKRQWKNLLKRCLMDYKIFYQTRHTFASMFLINPKNLKWVSSVMLGHASIQTTLKYYDKYIKQDNIVYDDFLSNERTNNVQDEKLSSESA